MPVAKMPLKTYGVIVGSIAAIYFLMNWKKIATGMFGESSFVANMDLIAYLIYASLIVMPAIILTDKSLTKDERERIIVVFILAFFVIFFWACFEQAGASLTLFADQQVKRDIVINISKYVIMVFASVLAFYLTKALGWFFEWSKKTILTIQGISVLALVALTLTGNINDFHKDEFPASWFQSINPLAIIILAPMFTMLWGKLAKFNMEPSSPLKMSMGLALVSLGFVIIAFAVKGLPPSEKIAMTWLFAFGLSMVSKLAPLRLSSLMMGTWFLANAVANKFAGTLSALIPPGAGEEPAAAGAAIPSFLGIEISNLFIFFCVFIVLSGAASLILVAGYRKLIKMMHGVN
jgi:POT family proton-dependent oligopeptide transporter